MKLASVSVILSSLIATVTIARADTEPCPVEVTDSVMREFPSVAIVNCSAVQVNGRTQYEVQTSSSDYPLMIVAVSIDARVLRTTAGVDAADVPPEVGRAFDETYPSARASHIEKRQNYRGVTYEITFGWQNGTWRATFTDRGRLLSAVANVEPITAPARSRSAVRSTRRCLPCG